MKFGLLFIIMILSAAVINSLILIIKREEGIRNSLMLDTSLFFYNLPLLAYFLWFEAGFIVEAPHLLRVLSPVIYLCAPFFYFFIRNSLFNTTGFRKLDWIHFLPALFHLLELIPFFMQSYEVKLSIAETLVSDPTLLNVLPSGLIPISFHYSFRIFLQTVYFVYAVYLVYTIRPDLLRGFKRNLKQSWLVIVLFFMGWVVVFQLIFSVLDVLKKLELMDLSNVNMTMRLLSLVGILLLNVFINFKPMFLVRNAYPEFGKPRRKIKNFGKKAHLPTELEDAGPISTIEADKPLLEEYNESLKGKIIHLLEQGLVINEKGMTLMLFSIKLGIPPKLVSQEINKEFGKGFNELLNQYRIKFAIEKIEHGYLDDFTVEALGELSGFNSRTTFFNAFKKEIGCSPKEFWKRYQHSLGQQ
ncbi:hypothetical protein P872_24725 [Rhodonellum psychrophilum GCM71 = DSM 17998]|uniref:HTH araC/xylS-type domain-containing protein n=2 Tax=Rhodonellum TaxID=336827 RepID=U5C479_9BACT|nr:MULTISPECIES: helix-turn-helix domain-containing protein [Rhodonellum]ERM84624.1 hypothetical protein P872_24725 [Rhodonellum psychrophilum GCM71 = DSM 17998]SDY86881.1 Helix-turn-helix domain-containing protein [Rhodonellum ikkaensis]